MAVTKPAGCALQLLAVPVLLGGFTIAVTGFTERAPVEGVTGLLLLGAGLGLLRLGRPPGLGKPPARATKACPQCAEEILATAKKCKHCGSAVA